MVPASPRLRVFAGPNGSGKSTIQNELRPAWLGTYVNADDIEKILRTEGSLDLGNFGLAGEHEPRLQAHFMASTRRAKGRWPGDGSEVRMDGLRLCPQGVAGDSYFAAEVADYIRWRLLEDGRSFTFETVMSFRDKVAFMSDARQRGYRTYLYFVATDDPTINIGRVRERVKQGGHPVPEDTIRSRYHRSIALMAEAVRASHRAYIFDNSEDQHELIAEVTDGQLLQLHVDEVPRWFTASSLWAWFNETS